jgi:hypothetical protein
MAAEKDPLKLTDEREELSKVHKTSISVPKAIWVEFKKKIGPDRNASAVITTLIAEYLQRSKKRAK